MPAQRLLNLLQVEYPIIQAPMVGVSTPELAAAVSNAGGLGSIGIGACSVDSARELIARTRALTDSSFNVNLFCHQSAKADPEREQAWLQHLEPIFSEFDAIPPADLSEPYKSFLDDSAMLELLLEVRPAVVSFHFGVPPEDWVQALKQAGIVTLGCATSLDEAASLEAVGIDAIVAQGFEAGGHRGVFNPESGDREIGTLALVRLIADRFDLPVIAAGGIMDGAGISAAIQLGASAVQMGTAFILCPESSANDQYRKALKSDRSYYTQVTSAISGRPARGIVNRFYTDLCLPNAPAMPDYPIAYEAGKALVAAASAAGNQQFSVQWAGQGAPLTREMPAGDLVLTLVNEWRALAG